ncbi:Uma2 family endonuclease [Candidatus Poribacteria bacterium]|nr:Uma2 family endonuclease [Candidatus Poribacteria bacterium]MYA58465.1 Uma2 family endonuclease [Candidatus Poribacteria bacterium]
MQNYPNQPKIPYAPTETELYPETDGKPMAVSDMHRRILTRIIQTLENHFSQRPEVYVSGDILMYYVEGQPQKVVTPDALITFGMGQKPRLTYKVWEEGKVPDFVMEMSSKTTYRNDLGEKMELYASLGIQDYVLYDAEGLYLPTSLMGFTLVDGRYVAISPNADGGIYSEALGLEFRLRDMECGIYDPVSEVWLQTPAEAAEARAESAETRAENAESEAAKLREQLARLQARSR